MTYSFILFSYGQPPGLNSFSRVALLYVRFRTRRDVVLVWATWRMDRWEWRRCTKQKINDLIV
ncbi:hypothetical protein I7I48_03751 [Histoplasma ohiense]|nr:hypothetical protein I7I48_03751 [Histoplasma ohiense (nom. inval.)]